MLKGVFQIYIYIKIYKNHVEILNLFNCSRHEGERKAFRYKAKVTGRNAKTR